jgi:hypothetical protein
VAHDRLPQVVEICQLRQELLLISSTYIFPKENPCKSRRRSGYSAIQDLFCQIPTARSISRASGQCIRRRTQKYDSSRDRPRACGRQTRLHVLDRRGDQGLAMAARSWRQRREAYLRERDRLADLIREGYVRAGLAVIEGSGHRLPSGHPALIVIHKHRHAPIKR